MKQFVKQRMKQYMNQYMNQYMKQRETNFVDRLVNMRSIRKIKTQLP